MNVGNYSNIPLELRLLKQWVVWREGKVPFQTNGQIADVTNSGTYCTFQDAINALQNSINIGIGFCFTDSDPYSFIDLDNANGDQAIIATHLKIAHEFNSYSEVSPSGMGLHIIVKGTVIAGRRRSKVEIYSSGRYATMTGQVHNNSPINDCQSQLTMLWEQMGSGPIAQSLYQGNDKEEFTDEEIIKKATNAINGDKFAKLLKGDWQDLYSSQSEADFSFVDIISFYTQNRNQITRIFRNSPLGFRDKAKRSDYVSRMISRSFDRMLPPLDFDGLKNAIELKLAQDQLGLPLDDSIHITSNISNNGTLQINGSVAQRSELAVHNSTVAGSSPVTPTTQLNLPMAVSSNGKTTAFDAVNVGSNPSAAATLPPGLLGNIAEFIYQAAPRPVEEIALAGAIGLMAGVCGKAYNISGTGLNQYLLMIADSGKGKEAMASGISKLINVCRLQVPVANDFIGPSAIASSPGLHKYLSKNSQCFVSILGEFGIKLEAMSNLKANSVQLLLKDSLLDLYHKSGYNDVYRGSAYSDQDKNSIDIPAPAFSILGESTPERFYSILNEEMISEGLLPRFSIIEYNGIRVPSNENPNSNPSFQLIEKFCALMAHCKTIMASNKIINVEQDLEAFKATKEIDRYADYQINSANKEVTRQLWNRAHIKTLKLSATVAIGVNPYNPIITVDNVNWAWGIVQNDIKALSIKFEQGLIGSSSSETKQVLEMKRVMKDYLTEPWEKVKNYSHSQSLYDAKLITYVYLNKRLTPVSAFKNDKLGPTASIKRCIQILIDSDYIKEVGKVWMNDKFGTSQRAFAISNTSFL